MEPTVGRIVLYKLTEDQAKEVNRRRTNETTIAKMITEEKWPLGAQAHIGNFVYTGFQYPMIIVSVWKGDIYRVNGQVFLDGNDVLWVLSVKEGTENGEWSWPTINKEEKCH
jgi:hypothetical protein